MARGQTCLQRGISCDQAAREGLMRLGDQRSMVEMHVGRRGIVGRKMIHKVQCWRDCFCNFFDEIFTLLSRQIWTRTI
jgi:hypothetical protein